MVSVSLICLGVFVGSCLSAGDRESVVVLTVKFEGIAPLTAVYTLLC